jgi:dTDP-4-amino-4,6-dideoxygalactose transaminase
VDLRAQYATIKKEIDSAMLEAVASGEYILGKPVETFEREMARFCGTRYAVGVASGTDALHLALKACGVGPGDEVITTPFTFIATVQAIVHCGATPVFADIEPTTYNMSCDKIETLITERTKAILPVHLYGHPVDMDPVMELARRFELKVVEDCAQALGAKYKGQPVGSLGDAGCLSFFPSKNLGAYGDGGMVVTSNPQLAQKVDLLRRHGSMRKYYHEVVGVNSRLDALQAAVLRVKLRHLDKWISERRERAGRYNELLSGIPENMAPTTRPYAYHAFNYFTIRVDSSVVERDQLQQHLSEQGIATVVYYPLGLHLQPAFEFLGYGSGNLPETEKAQREVLSLPLYPELDMESQERVVEAIKKFVREKSRIAL